MFIETIISILFFRIMRVCIWVCLQQDWIIRMQQIQYNTVYKSNIIHHLNRIVDGKYIIFCINICIFSIKTCIHINNTLFMHLTTKLHSSKQVQNGRLFILMHLLNSYFHRSVQCDIIVTRYMIYRVFIYTSYHLIYLMQKPNKNHL